VRSFAACSSLSPSKPPQLFPTENNMGGDSGAKASPCTPPWRRETPTAFFDLRTTRVVTHLSDHWHVPFAGEREALDGGSSWALS
jgi:hypothetical protein